MKRYNHLFEKIISFENLLIAARKAQKGKRFNDNVASFNLRLESELLQLQQELTNHTYQPGKYTEFYIYEPKKRMISAAPYRDRVIHHAVCNIIEPIFEKIFIFDSYANRKNKGTHAAIDRFQQFSRINKYVLKADIKKYFPSIVHYILKNEIRKKIKCSETLWLTDLIIDNSNKQENVFHFFGGDDLFTNSEIKKGLPMGNLTSQFFANVYLNALDHFVKEQLSCKHYIRYVDDFVLFSNSKTDCNFYLTEIEKFLCLYRLKLHENKSKIFRTFKGVSFLGQQIFPEFRLLKRENVNRAKKRLNRKHDKFLNGKISKGDFVNSYIAWYGHAKNANTFRLCSKISSKFADVFWDEPFFTGVVFRYKE